MADLFQSILQEYWHYTSFRDQQKDIIHHAVVNQQHSLVIMPTGGGKSVCYQVAALASDGFCIVVSPLIALMIDQVMQLKQRGILASAIYTGMQKKEIHQQLELAEQGKIKLLYVSPERLQTELFQNYLSHCKVNLIAVDEAHCISQWGYDFRPAYLQIQTLREFFPNTPVMALTATATEKVQQDIQNALNIDGCAVFRKSYERPALSYSVFDTNNKLGKLTHVLSKVAGSALVYCATRRQCEEITKVLVANALQADYYHAGIEKKLRQQKQEQWIKKKMRIMVCTNAFGMGIDKPDVRLVVHYNLPLSLESYYQEAGRAGRDGKKSYAVLLYNEADLTAAKEKIEYKYPPLAVITKVYIALNNFYKIEMGKSVEGYFDFEIEKTLPLVKDVAVPFVLGAIEMLKQFKVIQILDHPQIPARIYISCNKNYLTEFQRNVPALAPLIEYIVRHVEGVWHEIITIFLDTIAKQMRCSATDIHRQLLILERGQLLHYYPAITTTQISFLLPRETHLKNYIDVNTMQTRKEVEINRFVEMERFVLDRIVCKSQLIGAYFNDHKLGLCAICDVCLDKKKQMASPKDLENLQNDIVNQVKKSKSNINDLQQSLQSYLTSDVEKMIQFLVQEETITYNAEGFFSIRK